MESSFTLDCIAVSSISQDYSRTNPKLGPALPPYNSKKDNHARNYFRFIGVDKTLKKTNQVGGHAWLAAAAARVFCVNCCFGPMVLSSVTVCRHASANCNSLSC